jgi:diacylglycerol kinase family enzyme
VTAVLVAYRKTARRFPEVLESVRAELASRHPSLSLLIAESPEALGQRRDHLSGTRLIYSAGGDGLLRDLVNIIGNQRTQHGTGFKRQNSIKVSGQDGRTTESEVPVAFGVIPMGTGNEIARALRIPLDPLRAARALSDSPATLSAFSGRVALLDGSLAPMAAGGTYPGDGSIFFVNSVGTGIDSATVEARDAFARLRLNHYLLTFLCGVLPRLRPFTVRVFRDGELTYEGDSVWIIALRGSCIGGGILLNPEADLTNPEMDLIVVKGASRLQILREMGRVFRGRASESPLVVGFKGASFLIEFNALRSVSIDGDILMTARRLLLEKGPAFHILVPPSSCGEG